MAVELMREWAHSAAAPVRHPRARGIGCCAVAPVLLLAAGSSIAHREDVPGPDPGTRAYGSAVIVLANGNYLVTDPEWSAGAGLEAAGAVYFHAPDGSVLGRLAGSSAEDRIGSGGIVQLPSGDVVVQSPGWDAPGAVDAGAVTWVSDDGPGAMVQVSAANSLVGGSADDRVGEQPIVVLESGDYVVPSGGWDRPGVALDAGAATWCAADGSTVGPVSATNSLVGTRDADHVGGVTIGGAPGVVALRSGHYVVLSSSWDEGVTADVGAVTWARGDGSTVGAVGSANSLTGGRSGDYVGSAVLALANGHYVVQSWLWDSATASNVGAATWADGTQSSVGVVSAANSLIGTQAGDRVGYLAAALANGNYVVASPLWDSGTILDAGAVTWRAGAASAPGVVDASNSLVGSTLDDTVGQFTTIGIPPLGVVPLPNGDYVVASPSWDDGAAVNVGAATWGSGTQATVGEITSQNSLVGAAARDEIAQYIVVLASGDYVVASPYWSESRGAATYGAASGGVAGVIDESNSLVGVEPDDFVTAFGVYPLADGGYAVPTPRWGEAEATLRGAVTRAAPGVGISGQVSAQNSLVGRVENERVGSRGVVALPDGGLLVQSSLASGAGAVTRFAPAESLAGVVLNPLHSLVGRLPDDRIGNPGTQAEPDGTLVLFSASAGATQRGAVTLLPAGDRLRGFIFEPDTVRSAVDGGGARLRHAWLPAVGTLVVGDPAANRVVRLAAARILRDGFE